MEKKKHHHHHRRHNSDESEESEKKGSPGYCILCPNEMAPAVTKEAGTFRSVLLVSCVFHVLFCIIAPFYFTFWIAILQGFLIYMSFVCYMKLNRVITVFYVIFIFVFLGYGVIECFELETLMELFVFITFLVVTAIFAKVVMFHMISYSKSLGNENDLEKKLLDEVEDEEKGKKKKKTKTPGKYTPK